MTPHYGEHCQNCLKHEPGMQHDDGLRCGTCLREEQRLRRCASCKLIRYCSRECQKQHWKRHKEDCQFNVRVRQFRREMGPNVAERQRHHEKWCENNVQWIAKAAMSALEVMRDWKRKDTHLFLLYVDVEQAPPYNTCKLKFRRSVREAHCIPLSQAHQMFDRRFSSGHAGLEHYLTPHPGLMQMLVVDDGLPKNLNLDLYTLPVDLGPVESNALRRFDPDWLPHLKQCVDDKSFKEVTGSA